jgi:hypothetical protein
MAKQKIGTITKQQQYVANRKASREQELELNGGWTAKHKVHKSMKNYSRKDKHKTKY